MFLVSVSNFDLSGAPAGARGAAARRVAFLRKKLRKNLFGKRFFIAQWSGGEHKPPMPEGARPVFAEGKDRLRWAFLFLAHFSLGEKKAESIKFPLFRRGGFHIRPSSNFDLSVCCDRGTEQN